VGATERVRDYDRRGLTGCARSFYAMEVEASVVAERRHRSAGAAARWTCSVGAHATKASPAGAACMSRSFSHRSFSREDRVGVITNHGYSDLFTI